MNKGAIALSVPSGSPQSNWSAERWQQRLERQCPGHPVFLWPNENVDPATIRYAAVWKPKPGLLTGLPNLAVIFNLAAGVDAVLVDRDLPDVPLVRAVVDDLTQRMTEYIVMHVLMYHRQQHYLAACQRERRWEPREQWAAPALRVGILGFGVLGQHAAVALRRFGFSIAGWSKSKKTVDGIETFAGEEGFAPFLARTDLLVCLLPATAQTQGILNRRTFSLLARDGVLGGPVIINAGRGKLQVESDILAALNDGTLVAATLDVFETEPLPESSPLWTHPKVTISPHNAADSDPDAISLYVAEQIDRFERGLPLVNVVDRTRGY